MICGGDLQREQLKEEEKSTLKNKHDQMFGRLSQEIDFFL